MSDVPRRYQKLPGRTSHVVGVARLWAHDDHLLATTNYFGVEQYQRYYFGDIQALMIQRTKVRMWWNLGLGFIVLLLGLMAAGFWYGGTQLPPGGQSAMNVFAGMCGAGAGLFLLGMLINTVRGATCVLVAQMPAGPQTLPGATRVRPARRILALLAPRIRDFQSAAPVSQAPA